MIPNDPPPPGKTTQRLRWRCRTFLMLLVCLGTGSSTAFGLEEDPTLYIRWSPGPDLYDTLTVTVSLAVDQNTPNGSYTIRSEQTTNGSNHSDHTFNVTDGVASPVTFTIGNYPLFLQGAGPTGILLWVKDAPTDQYATVTETYNYIDGGLDPGYHSHQINPPINYIDTLMFHLDAAAFGENIEEIQAVPEPATWIGGVLAGSAAIVLARRRRRHA